MKKKPIAIVSAIILLTIATGTFAQDRGLLVAARAVGGQDVKVGRQYAVLIAIDKYREWNSLRNPVHDAKAIKDILSRRYFIDEFIELYDDDATSAGIRRLFGKLIDTIGPTDSVLVYFAGHGYTDRFKTGFWIPVDGGKNIDSQDRWIPNQQIRNFITQMKARSVALVADSCFSGDLLNVQRGATPTIDSEYYRSSLRYTARQVLTSGASESVPDESEFARQFKNLLESNTEACLDPLSMYDRIRRGVTKTLPLYGTLPGQEAGGSFVLFLRGGTLPSVASVSASTSTSAAARMTAGSGDAELIVKLSGGAAAEVYVNDELVGTSSSLIQKLPSGVPLAVEARSGYDVGRMELTLKPRELKEVSLTLERMKGNLFIESNEKSVDVYLDGLRVGPLGGGLFRDVAAGERTLELRGKDLYYKSPVVISGNGTASVSAVVAGVGSMQVDAPEGVTVVVLSGGTTWTIVGPGTMADLPAGTYAVTASGSGYEKASSSVVVAKGTAARWKPYTTGTLMMRLQQPAAAFVSVDGGPELAVSPSHALEPGSHRLTFRAPGYHEKTETVSVEAGKAAVLQISLQEYARSTIEIPNPPFGATFSVGGARATVAGAGAPMVIRDIPAGLPLLFHTAIPFAERLDPAFDQIITLKEGSRASMDLPVGRISLPFLPKGAALVCKTTNTQIPLSEDSDGFLSPAFAAGTYTFSLSGPYNFNTAMTVESGKTIELPGYRKTMILIFSAERDARVKLLKAKSGKTTLGWASLGVGVASSAAATAVYFLGAQALSAYKVAEATVDVQTARAQVELYGALFPAAISIGAAGLGLAPVLWFGGPDPKVLERSIEAMDESLRRLREEQ